MIGSPSQRPFIWSQLMPTVHNDDLSKIALGIEYLFWPLLAATRESSASRSDCILIPPWQPSPPPLQPPCPPLPPSPPPPLTTLTCHVMQSALSPCSRRRRPASKTTFTSNFYSFGLLFTYLANPDLSIKGVGWVRMNPSNYLSIYLLIFLSIFCHSNPYVSLSPSIYVSIYL